VLESDWALVPILIASPKPLGATLDALLDHILNRRKLGGQGGNAGEWTFTNDIRVNTLTVTVGLRVCIPFRCDIPESWTASLIVFNTRVDGICHHVKSSNGRGGVCRGWHRHEWDYLKRTCKDLRNEIQFDHQGSKDGFLRAACDVFGLVLD
jgi:hypothetical protein